MKRKTSTPKVNTHTHTHKHDKTRKIRMNWNTTKMPLRDYYIVYAYNGSVGWLAQYTYKHAYVYVFMQYNMNI